MEDKSTVCKHCRKPIPVGADLCFRCKKPQGYISAKLEILATLTTISSLIVSLLLLALSWLQFNEAVKQRNSADKAVLAASNALSQAAAGAADALKAKSEAQFAKREAELARDETRRTVANLRSNIKLMLEMQHLTPVLVDGDRYDPAKISKVRNKLEEFAVPNQPKRQDWLKSLR